MLQVETLREDVDKMIEIIDRDRYTYLLFSFEPEDLDDLEDNLGKLKNRVATLVSEEINDETLNELVRDSGIDDMEDILSRLDRNGELVEFYQCEFEI
ncbi:hypothetical protein UT300012_22790 [Paraclostridium bifermentans]